MKRKYTKLWIFFSFVSQQRGDINMSEEFQNMHIYFLLKVWAIDNSKSLGGHGLFYTWFN